MASGSHRHQTDHTGHQTGHAGADHGSVKTYLTGFILSIILTVIPFGMVMAKMGSRVTLIRVIVALGLVQILVHLVYFLHMNRSSESRWNVTALVFTAVIMAIVVGGSLWIMGHLDSNMMLTSGPVGD